MGLLSNLFGRAGCSKLPAVITHLPAVQPPLEVLPTINPGDVCWCQAQTNRDFVCRFCGFLFGSDQIEDHGTDRFLVLVCYITSTGYSNCPGCGEVNDFPQGVIRRCRQQLPDNLMTPQADIPYWWLTRATPDEISEYFLKDDRLGDLHLQQLLAATSKELLPPALRLRNARRQQRKNNRRGG